MYLRRSGRVCVQCFSYIYLRDSVKHSLVCSICYKVITVMKLSMSWRKGEEGGREPHVANVLRRQWEHFQVFNSSNGSW